MPKVRRPALLDAPVERAIDVTNLTYDEVEVAARAWGVPPSARFVVHFFADTGVMQTRLTWQVPPVPLPEPTIKRACDLQVGDKIRHPETGDWLVILRYGDPGPDVFAERPTGLVGWVALNNRLQQVALSFLAAHEVPVYEEMR